jgi:hypothetical protein
MRKIQNAVAAAVLAAAVAGGGYAFFASPLVPTAQAHWRDHPKLEEAHKALKDAKDYLESAPSDFHGHKAEAIKAIDVAMHHLALCAEEARPTPLPNPAVENAPLAEHEKLRVARDRLKDARAYLHEAAHDFHGHREEAIKAIDVAIKQLDRILE